MKHSKIIISAFFAISISAIALYKSVQPKLPIIAIANYGPHASLEATIKGIKQGLANNGFIGGKNIKYEIMDVNFDQSMISQMIATLMGKKPKVIVTLSTPISQFAKKSIKDTPVVFACAEDPVISGIAGENITGSSDRYDMVTVFKFIKRLLPATKSIGIFYSTSESNNDVFFKDSKKAAKELGINLVAIAIDQARDIPMRISAFKNKVDAIFVQASGTVQPAFPVIYKEAKKMCIPTINFDDGFIREGVGVASFGINYIKVGDAAGAMVARILKGEETRNIKVAYPQSNEYSCVISAKNATDANVSIPSDMTNIEVVK